MTSLPIEFDVTKKNDTLINDSLTEGFRTQGFAPVPVHPVQAAIDRNKTELMELRLNSATFGMHAAFTDVRERTAAAAARRLPPLKSSLLSLDVMLGEADKLDFEDFLGVEIPEDQEFNKCIHSLIEKRRAI